MKDEKKEKLREFGFNEEIDAVDNICCPFCKKPVNVLEFKDGLSEREFNISGLCQKCQDETFG